MLDKVFGTVIDEFYWRFRGNTWVENCLSEESLSHPHRPFLIERIKSYSPFESILEVGCGSCVNLYLLAQKMPNVKLYGTDISNRAIKTGCKWFAEHNITLNLSVRKAEDLGSFSDKSVDIIFTDAMLIYIGPDKIERVIKEFIRVAKKVLIFNEWHSESSTIYDDHWIYNYEKMFAKFVSKDNIRITKIPEDFYGGNWAKYGYIIGVNLQ